jgi:hypothetical protein
VSFSTVIMPAAIGQHTIESPNHPTHIFKLVCINWQLNRSIQFLHIEL